MIKYLGLQQKLKLHLILYFYAAQLLLFLFLFKHTGLSFVLVFVLGVTDFTHRSKVYARSGMLFPASRKKWESDEFWSIQIAYIMDEKQNSVINIST